MTFLEHLEELRRTIIECIVALMVALSGAWFLAKYVQGVLIDEMLPEGVPVVALTVYEPFSSRLMVAVTIAVLVALPFLSWRVWRFVAPGLYKNERRRLLPIAAASTLLFYIGSAFGFFLLTPITIAILLSFGSGSLHPTISINALLDFVLKLCLSSGLVFQMPLVVTVLTALGVVSSGWLLARWRYAVLLIFVIAALVTPGDGPTQLVIGLPVTALYFVSVGLAKIVESRRQVSDDDDDETPPPDGGPGSGDGDRGSPDGNPDRPPDGSGSGAAEETPVDSAVGETEET
jgi:sec-independent protein translocase protein TatC